MKKVWSFILAILLLITCLDVLSAVAFTETSGMCGKNLTWTLTGDGVLTIRGSGAMYDWKIDQGILDLPWYDDSKSIKEVIISDGVTTIGNNAFSRCFELEKVAIPNSVISIGEGAFFCSGLTEIAIPDSVTTIGHGAFLRCGALERVTLSNSLTTIESATFSRCYSLKNVAIPDGVQAVEEDAFSWDYDMTEVILPTSVISIKENAFAKCEGLWDIYYGGNKNQWNAIPVCDGNSRLTDVQIHCNYDKHIFSTTEMKKIEELLFYIIHSDYAFTGENTLTSIIPGQNIETDRAAGILWNLIVHYSWTDDNGEWHSLPYFKSEDEPIPKEDCDYVLTSALGRTYPFYPSIPMIKEKGAGYIFHIADGWDTFVDITAIEKENDDYYVYFTYYECVFGDDEDYEQYKDLPGRPISDGVAVLYRNPYSIFGFTIKQCTPYSTEILVKSWENGADQTSFNSKVSAWAKDEVEEAYKNNLIPDTIIGKNLTGYIDRAEFAAVAVRLYEKLSGESAVAVNSPFNDIAGNKNADSINKAYALGITSGTTATTFEPDANITREQLATMLCRTIKKYSLEDRTLESDSEFHMNTSGVNSFDDDSDISDYAKPSVYYMAKLGIIKGIDDTHFMPHNVATKEQVILIALRIFNLSDEFQKEEFGIRINDNILNMIGEPYSVVKTYWGRANGAVWDMGVKFYFPQNDLYFCFEGENDETVTEPKDSSVCHALRCSLTDIVIGLENRTYTSKELSEAIGTSVKYEGVDEMEDEHLYSFIYDNLEVWIYAETKDHIAPNAIIFTRK